MADQEQVERLRAGVEEWNAWREGEGKGVEINLGEAKLTGADLRDANLYLASLKSAHLAGASLEGANLKGANLTFASLHGANLCGAFLFYTNLAFANLAETDLSQAKLGYAYLELSALNQANLVEVDLNHANLIGANLTGANFIDANLGFTSLGNLDLSKAVGLARTAHGGPSFISTRTLEYTARGLKGAPPERCGEIETFLRGAGVSEHFVDYFRGLIGQPVEFYSAFISYSHADKAFARRLYDDLQARGIRCWLDEKDMRLGDRIIEAVNQAIRSTDRVLLCCSLASLTSSWVEDEITMAFERERGGAGDILIPLDLDGYLFDGWQSGNGARIRARLAGKFEGWDLDARLYARELERVVEAMRPRGDHDGE